MSLGANGSTVFIVDDDAGIRHSFEMLFRATGQSVESFATAEAFLEAYDPTRLGCLVIDVHMPGMSGLDLQDLFLAKNVRIPMIIMTGQGDVAMAVAAVKKGAIDFLIKPFEEQVLLQRVEQALKADVQRRQEQARQAAFQARLDRLTPRERQVLDLLLAGKGNKEIALDLGLSRKTVDIHRAHIMMKFGVESLLEIAQMKSTNPL
ncbi:MAG: response regulator [Phycisphaerae bacterium]|nr:response regulator [Phycisphaerae bacterium]